jgi:hypothetical protein
MYEIGATPPVAGVAARLNQSALTDGAKPSNWVGRIFHRNTHSCGLRKTRRSWGEDYRVCPVCAPIPSRVGVQAFTLAIVVPGPPLGRLTKVFSMNDEEGKTAQERFCLRTEQLARATLASSAAMRLREHETVHHGVMCALLRPVIGVGLIWQSSRGARRPAHRMVDVGKRSPSYG